MTMMWYGALWYGDGMVQYGNGDGNGDGHGGGNCNGIWYGMVVVQ